jgi:hypothetical protein
MCCGPYDFDYPVAGGIHQRANPAYGRVGSIFSDPNAIVSGDSADSNLKDPPPPSYDEPETKSSSGDAERELEELNRELEEERRNRLRDDTDDLELIEPDIEDPDMELDVPGSADDDSTASERLRPRPLRGNQQWR